MLTITNGEVLGPDGEARRQDVRVRAGRIEAVAPALPPLPPGEEEILDGTGRLLMPGLINAHLHSHEHFNRGRFDNLPLEVWQIFARPPLGLKPLTPREAYLRTMVGCIEMLRSGTTTAWDDVYHFPLTSRDLADAVAQAYVDAGLRARISCNLMDKQIYESIPHLAELLPFHLREELDANRRPPIEELLGFVRDLLTRYPLAGGRIGLALAPSAPQRCSDRFLVEMVTLAAATDVPLITHVLETQAQVVTGHRFYGRSIVEHLAGLGALSPRTAISHGVWLTDADIALLATHHASVLHNPVSNLKLGSGIAPVRPLLRAGVNVGLGCDGTGSNDSQNMFEAMKFAALLNKVRGEPFEEWVGAAEVFHMATVGGARAALFPELGEIRPGWRADLVLVNLSRIPFVPRNHLLNQLVFCEHGSSVETVIIDGRIVMRDGQILTFDEAAMITEIQEVSARLRTDRAAADRKSEELLPYFREAWRRCASEPTPVNAYARR